MKAFAINVTLALFLAACTTTGEGSRRSETEVLQNLDIRGQQARFSLLPDDGIMIRQQRLKNPVGKRSVEGWLSDSGNGFRLTAEGARKLKTALVLVLNSLNESNFSQRRLPGQWELPAGLAGRGEGRQVINSEGGGSGKCRMVRIIFDIAGQWNRYNFEFCQVAQEAWVVTQPRARFKGDDFSDRSAQEWRNSPQDVRGGTVQTMAE